MPKTFPHVFFKNFNFFPILLPRNLLIINVLCGPKNTFYKLRNTFYKLRNTFYKLKNTFYKLKNTFLKYSSFVLCFLSTFVFH